MSFNACSINSSSFNALCGVKRKAVLTALLKEFRPSNGGGGGTNTNSIANNNRALQRYWDTHQEDDVQKYIQTELNSLVVYVNFMGITGSAEIDNLSNTLDLVYVKNINFEHNEEILGTAQILNFRIEH